MTDLIIPDAAVTLAHDALRPEPVSDPEVRRALEAAAPLIVAGELRILADRILANIDQITDPDLRSLYLDCAGTDAHILRQRANELDPAGGAA